MIEDEDLVEDPRFIERVDELLVALTNVRVDGDLELSVESERKDVQRSGASMGASIAAKPGLQLAATAEMAAEGRALLLETRRGSERIALNFSDVAPALRELAGTRVALLGAKPARGPTARSVRAWASRLLNVQSP